MDIIDAKYVMIDGQRPYLFPLSEKHSHARSLGNITSAGFVSITSAYDPVIQCAKLHFQTYGRSASMDLSPAPDDAFFIKTFLTCLSPKEREG